ncbi:TetR/AcrR family transcriptional regulator [Phenylobacterium hankyongense]|uniref:TetR/AcrR family transcriptional regulator n=1 Tax=Phenylobacterium hankyongense TaxID=1813876 RepID=A0A328B2G6_9CAUL|nr:TetR/AcrR family transcriptional regulator [Phenylobacterium hankyongense]RAK61017.1 TetR/AcrR family transcriptional regulator [Phenylobacterium hankyongense]
MSEVVQAGRPNQKRRTRKALLEAAARLRSVGRNPTLEEVAEEALVSRATAYRYFASVDGLLLESALDVAMPRAEDLFPPGAPTDPVARLERVDQAVHDMMVANEAPLRMMLAQSLERSVRGDAEDGVPARQNRRSPLIDAALEPARHLLDPDAIKPLSAALALLVGTEALVVLKDVLQLEDAEAREVKRWAIRALVEAARKDAN